MQLTDGYILWRKHIYKTEHFAKDGIKFSPHWFMLPGGDINHTDSSVIWKC